MSYMDLKVNLVQFHCPGDTQTHTETDTLSLSLSLSVYIQYAITLKVCVGLNCLSKKTNSGKHGQINLKISSLKMSSKVDKM